ncbi:uncharacterized protein LOC123548695 [Mercenaria mercenaria]|uniref:uncharacterized protein LOC123548695 n=1 Tax=Mercenaria mercenaria TaxID=6596 RepID=UPI00234EBD83|nr:uncharacterized protein LOC123548695 [Mercenaria mercenaria]
MDHQSELEKKKYRNWVRGGLAYKYLKEGIEGFADEVVQQEHTRILTVVSHTPGFTCNQCCLRNLRPLHKCEKEPVTGRNKCPWSQSNCNCVHPKKQACPYKVCDMIMEDILKGHGSTPPTPNWKNTEIQKWCIDPWEVAKCFINAPGYSDKTKAADIDTPGLIHIFINNINLQAHFSDNINGSDIFKQTIQRRNELFHSPTMEMEDTVLDKCIDEIIAILEDEKELKVRHDAKKAVFKLKQLKQESFIITTHDETEVCRDALASITNKSEELKRTIQDAKDDIVKKQKEVTDAIEEVKDDIGKKQIEAVDDIKNKTQLALQDTLQEFDKHSVYERLDRLELESSVSKQRLSLLESKVDKLESILQNRQKQLDYVKGKQVLQKKLVTMYQNHYVKTSISPLKLQNDFINIKEVYVTPEMVIEGNINTYESTPTENSLDIPNTRTVHQYRDIFQTNCEKQHKTIYILGNAGTGKSTFAKMMIQNWCSAVNEDNPNDKSEDPDESDSAYLMQWLAVNDENINEMKNYEFLFFVPLQRMSGLADITEMIKAITANADLAPNYLIDRLLEQESERCFIVADGLDEWTPPRNASVLQHTSYGVPARDRAKHARLVTLSRPSAKGILNMKSSEYDLKVVLVGINSVQYFIEKYLSKFNNTDLSYWSFMKKLKMANYEPLENTPLLLQQLVWLYGSGNEVGISVSDTYIHILNIMLGWAHKKEEGEDNDQYQVDVANQEKDMQLPKPLQRFPRCEANKQFLLPLARVAFEALTSDMRSSTFGRTYLQKRGVSKECITSLIRFGILVENTCFDPTQENTQLEFIHVSYLEFFAAVHISIQFDETQQCSVLQRTHLQDLIQTCKSAGDVLQLSNVLKMICGLSPFLLSELSKLVSDIVSGDDRMFRYRNSLSECMLSRLGHVSDQIQYLIFNCLCECDPDNQPMITLRDVILDYTAQMSFLQRIIQKNVLSLNIQYLAADGQVWRWVSQLKLLQYIYIGFSRMAHSEMASIASLIGEVPLKKLSLCSLGCNYCDCDGHEIDLSKNDQIQKLELTGCKRVFISNINTKPLEIVRLDSSSISYIGLLLNAVNLAELCLGHTLFDYCKYNKQVASVVHTLQKLRKLKLEKVDIGENLLVVKPVMKNLELIVLWEVRMSIQTWFRFVDSLLSLQQSVQLNTAYCPNCAEIDGEGRNYVNRNATLFEVLKNDRNSFSFRTNK